MNIKTNEVKEFVARLEQKTLTDLIATLSNERLNKKLNFLSSNRPSHSLFFNKRGVIYAVFMYYYNCLDVRFLCVNFSCSPIEREMKKCIEMEKERLHQFLPLRPVGGISISISFTTESC